MTAQKVLNIKHFPRNNEIDSNSSYFIRACVRERTLVCKLGLILQFM